MRSRYGTVVLVAVLVGACGGQRSGGERVASLAAAPTAAAASCAGLSPAQQRRAARVIVVGTMLPGPTLAGAGRRVLASPARLRVERYLKGRGPATIHVLTAVAAGRAGAIRVTEDGIEPRAGERWEILSSSRRQPLSTSICLGSHRLAGG